MNSDQKIIIKDMPYRIRGELGNLSSEDNTYNAEKGRVISEVGDGKFYSHPAMDKRFYAYELRKRRKYKIPGHVFGKAFVGGAFSAFMPIRFTVPAVGASITLNPVVTTEQRSIINLYKFINADAFWVICVPSPIGTSLLLKAYAPEFDVTTETRGVRWRTQNMPSIAFSVPWSNDLTMIPNDLGRGGQSGLSIKIQCIDDNTLSTVASPLTGVAFCCVYNLALSNLRETDYDPVSVGGLNFTPTSLPFEDSIVEFMESEVNADATNDVSEDVIQTSEASNLTSQVEKLAQPAKKPKKSSAGKNQTGALNTIWKDWQTVTFNTTQIGNWVNLMFNPYNFSNKGEAFNLPYRRNIWTSGERRKGYVTTTAVKWPIPRPPQLSGVVEIQDSRNKSSRTIMMYGETKEFELTPRNFAIVPNNPVRYVNNPWLRTNEASNDFRYRLLAHNRTADIADIASKLAVRPGGAVFQGPTKPRARANLLNLDWLVQKLEIELDVISLHMEVEDTPFQDEHDDEHYIAPLAGDEGEMGETNETHGEEEFLDQSEFGLEIFRGNLNVDEPLVIPINLSVISDATGDGTNNTVTQLFERYAHIQPKTCGPLGPMIGKYIIKVRLPTSVAGDIEHVYLPDDVNDEVVATVFGLGQILSLATAAIQGVGGPLLSGALQMGRNILGPVLGNLLGGVGDKKNTTDTANNLALGGDLSLSRFMNFLKPVVQNEMSNPTFGSLLLKARDFVDQLQGRAITQVPISVFLRLDEFEVERSVWNRTVTPLDTMVSEIRIQKDRIPYLFQLFNSNKNTLISGTRQNKYFKKLIAVLREKNLSELQSISLVEIEQMEELSDEELNLILTSRSLHPPSGADIIG